MRRQQHGERALFLTDIEMDTSIKDATIKDFETAIAELERIVKQLEDGDLPLESSLQLYERGVHLSRYCHGRLEEAERRIEILNERGQLRDAGPDLDAPGDTRER
jgi:exodeoxyribonuclease VII small subunit